MRVCWLLAAAACGATPIQPPSSEPPQPRPLAEVLVREIGAGGSVAIIGGPNVRAVSSDGARQRVLVTEPAPWVLVDPRTEVVWFGNADATEIRAIDLEATAIKVETVVVGLPPPDHVQMVGPVLYGISYVDPAQRDEPRGMWFMMREVSLGDSMAAARVTLLIDTTPELSGSSGYVDDQDWDTAVGRATILGKAFLHRLLARPDHRHRETAAETRVDVDTRECEEPASCGVAQTIPGTSFVNVVVGTATGDVHHVWHKLYDTRTKRFIEADWGSWLQNTWVAPDRSGFLRNGTIIRFDRGPVSTGDGSLGGGWLGGGVWYGL
jgi:hypothetical protein